MRAEVCQDRRVVSHNAVERSVATVTHACFSDITELDGGMVAERRGFTDLFSETYREQLGPEGFPVPFIRGYDLPEGQSRQNY